MHWKPSLLWDLWQWSVPLRSRSSTPGAVPLVSFSPLCSAAFPPLGNATALGFLQLSTSMSQDRSLFPWMCIASWGVNQDEQCSPVADWAKSLLSPDIRKSKRWQAGNICRRAVLCSLWFAVHSWFRRHRKVIGGMMATRHPTLWSRQWEHTFLTGRAQVKVCN